MRSRRLLAGLAALVLLTVPAHARTQADRQEVLRQVYGPEADFVRRTRFLTEAQMEEVHRLAGGDAAPARPLVTLYEVRRGEELAGVALVDTHRVRTKSESLLVALDAAGAVLRVEVLAFAEPPDYLPRPAWLKQFPGRGLDEDLRLQRGIRGMTGATLTAAAITLAVRRGLAVAAVLYPETDGTGRKQ